MNDFLCVPMLNKDKYNIYMKDNNGVINIDNLQEFNINRQALYIISLIDNNITINDINNKLSIDYPDIAFKTIEQDTLNLFYDLWLKEIVSFDKNPFNEKYEMQYDNFKIKIFNIDDCKQLINKIKIEKLFKKNILYKNSKYKNLNQIKALIKYNLDYFVALYNKNNELIMLIDLTYGIDNNGMEIDNYYLNKNIKINSDEITQFLINSFKIIGGLINHNFNNIYINIMEDEHDSITFFSEHLKFEKLGVLNNEIYFNGRYKNQIVLGKKLL